MGEQRANPFVFYLDNHSYMEEHMPQNTPKKGNPAMWIILIIVVLIAVAAFLYYGGFFDTNTNSNTNTVANTNTGMNTNTEVNTNSENMNTSDIDTSDWKTYENTKYGYSFMYPGDWSVKNSKIVEGSYATSGTHDEFIISPTNSSLDFAPASNCYVMVYTNPDNLGLEQWVQYASIYKNTGLQIITEENFKIDGLEKLLVTEGGANFTKSQSLFYKNSSNIIRFSYYKEVDVSPVEEFKKISLNCEKIQSTLNK